MARCVLHRLRRRAAIAGFLEFFSSVVVVSAGRQGVSGLQFRFLCFLRVDSVVVAYWVPMI